MFRIHSSFFFTQITYFFNNIEFKIYETDDFLLYILKFILLTSYICICYIIINIVINNKNNNNIYNKLFIYCMYDKNYI